MVCSSKPARICRCPFVVRLMVRAYKRERSEEELSRLQRELAGKDLGIGAEEEIDRMVFEDR